jgi:hypothetical protein
VKVLKIAASVFSFGSTLCYLIIMLLVFTMKLPAGGGAGLFYTPPAFIFAVLAIYRPLAGGVLLLFAGALLFIASLQTNHYPQYYLPIGSLSVVGGILHLTVASKKDRVPD